GLRVVDAVSAGDMATGLGCDVETTAENVAYELQRERLARPRQQIDREKGTAAHRVDVGERVGCGDPAPVVGVIDDRREEVRGGKDCGLAVDADRGSVVAGIEADEEFGR